MSKWDEPAKMEELIVMVFGLAILCMVAVPIAFLFASLAGLVGLGGTQDMRTIIGSFAIVYVLGATALIFMVDKVRK